MKRTTASHSFSERNPGFVPVITEKTTQSMIVSRFSSFLRFIGSFALLFLITSSSFSQVDGDYQTRASGNWNDNNTWQVRNSGAWVNCLPGDYPGASAGAGTVYIAGGFSSSVTADVPNPVAAITFAGASESNVIDFTGPFTLSVSGQITINPPSSNGFTNNLGVNSGTLTCSTLTSITSGHNTRICLVTISTGTLTVNGNVSMGNNAARNLITFLDAGTLNVDGDIITGTLTGIDNSIINVSGDFFPTSYLANNSTVDFNGADQTIRSFTYGNVITSNSGTKTLANASFTISGNLNVSNSTTVAFTSSTNRNLTVGGNLSGDGTIDMSQGNRTHALYLGGVNNTIGALLTNIVASTVYYNRTGDQTIFSSPNYRNLTLLNGGDKSLVGDAIIIGTLNLSSGRLVLGDYDLTLSGTAGVASVNAARYVVADGTGTLRKVFAAGATGTYLLPVGDMVNYSPVSLSFASNSQPRTIGVNVTNTQHPDDGTADNFISRYWSFTNDQPGDYTYTASFTYLPTDLTGAHANLKVNRWDGSMWTQYNTTGASPVITVTGVTQTTAPLDNSDFTGRVNSSAIYLWNKARHKCRLDRPA